jgi:hypothetical protein
VIVAAAAVASSPVVVASAVVTSSTGVVAAAVVASSAVVVATVVEAGAGVGAGVDAGAGAGVGGSVGTAVGATVVSDGCSVAVDSPAVVVVATVVDVSTNVTFLKLNANTSAGTRGSSPVSPTTLFKRLHLCFPFGVVNM